MRTLGALVSMGFQTTLRLSRQLPHGDVLAQALWFGRYAGDLRPPRSPVPERTREILHRVRRDGFAVLEGYWSRSRCESAIRELDDCFARHSEAVHRAEDDRIFGIEHLSELARSFHDDAIHTELADAYTGTENVVAFTMANRIQRASPLGSGGGWHRDGFLPELKTLLYLTDVEEENGPFQFYAGSHRTRGILRDMSALRLGFMQNRIDDAVDAFSPSAARRCSRLTAPAGTLLVFDTRGIHTGMPLQAGKRYALTNYIGRRSLLSEENLRHFAPIVRAGPRVVSR